MPIRNNIIDEDKVKLETVVCRQCGSGENKTFIISADIKQYCTKEYSTVKCKNCGLVFLNPRPTSESIRLYYLEDDPEKAKRKPAFYEKVYFSLFRKIPLKNKGAVLDVGCGSGRYLYCLKEKGWNVKGIDIAYTEYGSNILGLDIIQGEFTKTGFPDESFDAVTFWWALEHMYDPPAVLKEAYRIIKKDGVLIIAVHNSDSFEAKVFKGYWFHLFLPKHLYHFSPTTLTNMLTKAGFNNVRIRHDIFSFGIIGSLQLYLNKNGIKITFTHHFFYMLSLLLDIVPSFFRKSGLITAYAYKE